MKDIDLKFQNLQEVYEYIRRASQYGSNLASSSEKASKFWDDNLGWNESFSILANGGYHPKSAKALKMQTYKFREAARLGLDNTLDLSVSGFTPIVPEFLAGSPTNMLDETDLGFGIAQRPIIKIGIVISILCNIEASTLLNRGAAIISLIDYLESVGKRCEVYLLAKDVESIYMDCTVNTEICIKKASDLWAPNMQAWAITHPAFFRRIVFRILESIKEFEPSLNNNYGFTSSDFNKSDWDVLFPEVSTNFWNDFTEYPSLYESVESSIDHIKKISDRLV